MSYFMEFLFLTSFPPYLNMILLCFFRQIWGYRRNNFLADILCFTFAFQNFCHCCFLKENTETESQECFYLKNIHDLYH